MHNQEPEHMQERNRDRDVVKIYLKDVSKTPLLTHDDEKRLSQQIEQAKTDQILILMDIHTCRRTFLNHVNSAIAGKPECMLSVDPGKPLDVDLMIKLTQLRDLVQACDNHADQPQKAQVAELVRELPLQLKFLDDVIQEVQPVVQAITSCEGAFLRFSQSQGMSREQFLSNYQNAEPDVSWRNFVQKHEAQATTFQAEIDRISHTMGVTAVQLQAAHKKLRVCQKLKDAAVEHMLKSNLRLVVSVAKRYINVSATPLLDLVQEGNIGLLKAIEKFNWRLGFRFSTYATWWIKQCVLKALNEQHRIIRVPSHMTDLVKKITRARMEHVQQIGYEPSVEEIAQMLDMDVNAIHKVWTVAQGTISLETPIGSEEEQTLSHVIEDPSGTPAFDLISEVDDVNQVCAVLSELTPKEERVIRMRFGIGMDRENTLEDIGQVFGVTRERVRQIEAKALHKLKTPELSEKLQQLFE